MANLCVEWLKIKKGKNVNPKITPPKKPFYTKISNQYASLPAYAPVGPPNTHPTTTCPTPTAPECAPTGKHTSRFRRKAANRYLARIRKRAQDDAENDLIDEHITMAEDETTALAKSDTTIKKRVAAERIHHPANSHTGSPTLVQRGRNASYTLRALAKRAWQKVGTK